MRNRQVDSGHYKFEKYVSKSRWASMWHQLDEVVKLGPENVLEIGPGPGLFKAVAACFGVNVETLDLDPDLNPDHVGSVLEMPFPTASYDAVCAFQMLEHIPFEESLAAFKEMCRVASRQVIISLPDARKLRRFSFYIPKFGDKNIFILDPRFINKKHEFDGEHYWEVNKAGFSLDVVIRELEQCSDARLSKTYRVPENTYHRFFVFDVKS
tara:strand:- start:397 stop:1029 length:633 start_codon:yes stop_codon:yes gene_type:complete